MSQEFNQDISIADAVNISSIVAIVVPIKPFKSQEKTVVMKAKSEGKDEVIFETSNFHYKVSKILYKDQVNVKEGDVIKALEANSKLKMLNFRSYHVEAKSMSPIYKVYHTKSELKTDDPRIIALRYFVDETKIEKFELIAIEGLDFQKDFQSAFQNTIVPVKKSRINE